MDIKGMLEELAISKGEWDTVRRMSKQELRMLMLRHNIVAHEGIPVIALEEEEMRMAFLAMKSVEIQQKRATHTPAFLKFVQNVLGTQELLMKGRV